MSEQPIDGIGAVVPAGVAGYAPTKPAPRPKLRITRETSGEVRSSPGGGVVQCLINPKLGAPGGPLTDVSIGAFNRPERLSPKAKLYCFEGELHTPAGRKMAVAAYYAMTPEETHEDARAWMTEGCEVTR